MFPFERSLVGALALVITAIPVQAAVDDHLRCYGVNDGLNLTAIVDVSSPQFGVDAGCKVTRARLFCVPAAKTVDSAEDRHTAMPITPLPVTGPDPGDRICYKLKCPAPSAPIPDQSATDQFGTRTVNKFKVSLLCTPAFTGAARFVDNGDGTVTDHYTGLQWEKKDAADGTRDYTDPHDADNDYSWDTTGDPPPNGTAFTDFLGQLNACTTTDGITISGGFAGHCDWRLPTIVELQTILAAPYFCSSHPCIDATFGPTIGDAYWSSTSDPSIPELAYYVFFANGLVDYNYKDSPFYVRAVRGGS